MVDAIPLHRADVDPRVLLPASLAALQVQAHAADVALTITVDPDVPARLSIDADKIGWCVSALVGNALRYVHRRSRVMPGGTIAVHVTCAPVARQVTFAVADDGPGIPAQTLQALWRVGDRGAGTGSSLRLMRDIALAHGGRLDVQSDTSSRAHGTTVQITLPAY